MPIQLNRAKPMIWRSPNDLNLGSDSDAQKLEGLTLAQERLISQLYKGISNDQLGSYADQFGMNELSASHLVERLAPSILQSDETLRTRNFEKRFAELIRIEFDTNRIAEEVLAIRATRPIWLERVGRTELLLSRALVELGFKKFLINDYNAVHADDIGELGFSSVHFGYSKIQALRDIFNDSVSVLQFENPNNQTVPNALKLITAMHHLIPTKYSEESLPVISIEYGIGQIRVSKVISRGSSPCTYCRDLWAAESNPNFLSDTFQLLSAGDQLDDSVSLLYATALAAKNICEFVDSGAGFGTNYAVNLQNRSVSEHNWQFHPTCECATKA